MAAVGMLPPLYRAIIDVYREAVQDAVAHVSSRLNETIEGCLQSHPANLTPEQSLSVFTRCLSAKLRVLRRMPAGQ
jgi:hypothetical protein